ncbi:ATP-binding protein [Saccharopolyspora erythraea]|uniref:ATP-binding protein n=1 Tax=Saccharopolyspora erythraea TaxID=1836 RepID=UPI002010EE02|nr:AAA family ATPase [Saccharopolyspora erythraea]
MTSAGGSRRHVGNLPEEDSSFVGRRDEVALGKRTLSQARLLTVTGPPGVGKSRVGLRVAAQVRRKFPDGVWLVGLAGLEDPALLPHTVLETLGVGDYSLRRPIDSLAEYLESRRLLLVLDNCEHLVQECATLVTALLKTAPRLRILITSRHLLGAEGEHVVTVPPLPVPDDDSPLPLEAVLASASVELFTARAKVLVPGFTVDASNCGAVAAICRRLEGLPLALELAAKWLRTMSVEQILTGLRNWPEQEEIPDQGARVARYHETLRASFDWSFELCSPTERTLWARASVFAADFDLESAEAVCSDDAVPREAVLELVVSLLDKSVLSRRDRAGWTRYRLLDPTRQYGAQRLAKSGDSDRLRRRHRDHYRWLAERAEARWFGPQQEDWHERMRSEHADLRAALEFCLTTPGEEREGLRLAGALWFCWVGGGWVAEGRHWLDHLLALATEPCAERAKALWANAWITTLQGDVGSALPMLDEARDLARRTGETSELTSALCVSGYAEHMRGNQHIAVEYLEQALEQEKTLGVPSAVTAVSRPILASTVLLLGDTERARALCEECLALRPPYKVPWSRSWALWVLGVAAWTDGDTRRAGSYARECLRIKQHLNDLVGVALSVELLAWAATEHDADRTARLLGASHTLWSEIGTPLFGFAPYVTRHHVSEEQARKTLGPRAFEDAFEDGRKLTVPEVTSYALQQSEEA